MAKQRDTPKQNLIDNLLKQRAEHLCQQLQNAADVLALNKKALNWDQI